MCVPSVKHHHVQGLAYTLWVALLGWKYSGVWRVRGVNGANRPDCSPIITAERCRLEPHTSRLKNKFLIQARTCCSPNISHHVSWAESQPAKNPIVKNGGQSPAFKAQYGIDMSGFLVEQEQCNWSSSPLMEFFTRTSLKRGRVRDIGHRCDL